ncbi:hypothetical protein [Planomicrobium sp. MB-3u-38]|uniref:hypothetical protein n=1 Tax=Planomicrobium sp. MB-3u-38 TaxID=2058318 RepID=UPI000C7D4A6E|nr:hypothetical protein [Planomicrobium sp. MB-3u-38]PKH09267.1 hypothetical protein CXF70_13565 [Planomicrobium sp. MB-3u-38]
MLRGKEAWFEITLSYLSDLESLFEETSGLWTYKLRQIKDEGLQLTQEEQDEYFGDYRYDEMVLLRETLPKIMKNSLVSNIYAFVEANFQDFCTQVNDIKGTTSKPQTDNLEGYKNFLIKNLDLENLMEIEEWNLLNALRVVRNRIMHSNGKVDFENKYHENAIKVINETEFLSIDEFGEIIVDDIFIDNALTFSKRILRNINKQFNLLEEK